MEASEKAREAKGRGRGACKRAAWEVQRKLVPATRETGQQGGVNEAGF